ncbi:uncharacterized protein LOC135305108 [Passer domesticus]|uniref:uncharacterized protein LOC135305108 n=1 Tax=Passer domesticus TaxID=48849 RepID=UPI0030FE15B3
MKALRPARRGAALCPAAVPGLLPAGGARPGPVRALLAAPGSRERGQHGPVPVSLPCTAPGCLLPARARPRPPAAASPGAAGAASRQPHGPGPAAGPGVSGAGAVRGRAAARSGTCRRGRAAPGFKRRLPPFRDRLAHCARHPLMGFRLDCEPFQREFSCLSTWPLKQGTRFCRHLRRGSAAAVQRSLGWPTWSPHSELLKPAGIQASRPRLGMLNVAHSKPYEQSVCLPSNLGNSLLTQVIDDEGWAVGSGACWSLKGQGCLADELFAPWVLQGVASLLSHFMQGKVGFWEGSKRGKKHVCGHPLKADFIFFEDLCSLFC